MRFFSHPLNEETEIYQLSFFGTALYVLTPEHQMFSFDSPPEADEEKSILRRAIKAFLLTNPSGFQRITDAMVADYQKTHRFKELLEYMQKVSVQIVSSLTESVFIDVQELEAVHRFPNLTHEGPFTRNVPEYLASYTPIDCAWIIESTDTGLLVVYYQHSCNSKRIKYVCNPSSNDEEFLTPTIFKNAIKCMLALDRNAFLSAYRTLNDHYLNTEPAWTPWFHQMSLMVDVYRLHQSKMEQASRFCPWIDYD